MGEALYPRPTLRMPSPALHAQAKHYLKQVPDLQPGYTVRVHERIQEGGKERVQVFEGLIIAMHRGQVATDSSFTVRRVLSGIGVEKVFPLHSPVIDKIEVKKIAETRRAKLYFLRGRSGKAARMNERFTTEGEFAIAVAPSAAPEKAPEAAPQEEVVAQAENVEVQAAAPEQSAA